jgi:hypothetical protein
MFNPLSALNPLLRFINSFRLGFVDEETVKGAASGAAAGTAISPGIGTVIGAGLGALGSYLGSREEAKGLDAQAAAMRDIAAEEGRRFDLSRIEEQRRYELGRQDVAPYRETGTSYLPYLEYLTTGRAPTLTAEEQRAIEMEPTYSPGGTVTYSPIVGGAYGTAQPSAGIVGETEYLESGVPKWLDELQRGVDISDPVAAEAIQEATGLGYAITTPENPQMTRGGLAPGRGPTWLPRHEQELQTATGGYLDDPLTDPLSPEYIAAMRGEIDPLTDPLSPEYIAFMRGEADRPMSVGRGLGLGAGDELKAIRDTGFTTSLLPQDRGAPPPSAADTKARAERIVDFDRDNIKQGLISQIEQNISRLRGGGQVVGEAVPGIEESRIQGLRQRGLAKQELAGRISAGTAGFEDSPMYTYQLEKGREAVDKYYASRGGYRSSGARNALANLEQALAAEESEKHYGRVMNLANLGMHGAGIGMQQPYTGSGTMAQIGTQQGAISAAQGRQRGSLYSNLGALPLQGMSTYYSLAGLPRGGGGGAPVSAPVQDPGLSYSGPATGAGQYYSQKTTDYERLGPVY